jgi:hypothetical protein
MLPDGATNAIRIEGIGSTTFRTLHLFLIARIPPMLVGGQCATPTNCAIAARETDGISGDDLFYYVSANGSYCGATPLATSADNMREWQLTESSCSTTHAKNLDVQYLWGTTRTAFDRADDVVGDQVRIMYVLPADANRDRQLDLNGTLANSVGSWQNWLSARTGGRTYRLDTYQGALDIGFYQMSRTDAQARSGGEQFVRDTVERELRNAGVLNGNKRYAVFYEGGSTFACGGAAWPDEKPGLTAVMYLRAVLANGNTCGGNTFAASPTAPPTYWEFAMVHDLTHTLGIVSRIAPNHTLDGHVNTDPTDLMYAGPLSWNPSVLDYNHMNYYNAAGLPTGIQNLATSTFLKP